MKLIVLSDSHDNYEAVYDIVTRNSEKAESFIHLGDGVNLRVMEHYSNIKYNYVVGNHDGPAYQSSHYASVVLTFGSRRIFMTHGDKCDVKLDLLQLVYEGKAERADIILFGHTHKSLLEIREGITLLNPGAVAYPRNCAASYAVIDINGEECYIKIVSL
ncbi:MAG: metallophosphoesterase [Eubacteriaceae bacterium]|nr:metallophosphoesterase [Eubacteriaceae bacterium]